MGSATVKANQDIFRKYDDINIPSEHFLLKTSMKFRGWILRFMKNEYLIYNKESTSTETLKRRRRHEMLQANPVPSLSHHKSIPCKSPTKQVSSAQHPWSDTWNCQQSRWKTLRDLLDEDTNQIWVLKERNNNTEKNHPNRKRTSGGF